MNIYVIALAIVLVIAIVCGLYALNNEEKVLEKANKTNSMFNFYHILALMTSPNYKGYISTKEEEKAMEDYLSTKTEYDNHPIGSFFKLRKENDDVCQTAGNFHGYALSFKASELSVGFATLIGFGVLLAIAIMYS